MPSTRKSSPAPSSADRKAGRQREILEAAVRAFSRHGYHNCPVSRVAREAGVADGTIYLYFPSKEVLLIEAFRHVLSQLLEEMDREMETMDDPVRKLRRTMELHFQFMQSDPELAAFLQFQLRQPDRSVRAAIGGPLADYSRRIEAILAEGQTKGVIRADQGTRTLRRVFFGAMDETVSAWCLRSDGSPLVDRAEPLLELLLNGMLTNDNPTVHPTKGGSHAPNS
jgi:TetR/AcrR family fatty acid metabolism transcriptional regulator